MLTSSLRKDVNFPPKMDDQINQSAPSTNQYPYFSSPHHSQMASVQNQTYSPAHHPNQPYGYQGIPQYQQGNPYFNPRNQPHPQQMASQTRLSHGLMPNDKAIPGQPVHNHSYPSNNANGPLGQEPQRQHYALQNDPRPMHFHSSTHNTNNNHMVQQPPQNHFQSPRMRSSLPPPPQLQGHGSLPTSSGGSTWTGSSQYRGAYPTGHVEQPAITKDHAEDPVSEGSTDNNVTPNKRAYPCPKCQKVFKRGDHLKRHLLSVHDREHPYQCGECSKGFASVATLTRHLQAAHSDNTSKGIMCMRCNIRLPTLTELEVHSNSLHKLEDAEYMKNINKSSKTFQCEMCLKTVSTEKNLKRHIKKQHGENARDILSCSVCEHSFISSSNLKDHMQRAHSTQLSAPPISQLSASSVKQVRGQNNFPMQNLKGIPSFQQMPAYPNLPSSIDSPSHKYKHEQQPSSQVQPSQHVYEKTTVSSKPNAFVGDSVERYTSDYGQHQPNMNGTFSSEDRYMTISSSLSVSDDLVNNSKHLLQGNINKETNSVSEAFSIAMKTLSDFAYDDFLGSCGEYVPISLSSFQSNSALPNFHYPASVSLDQGSSVTQGTAVIGPQALCAVGLTGPYPPVTTNEVKPNIANSGPNIELDSQNMPAVLAIKSRGGKKKRQQGSGSDSDDLLDNGMIVKGDSTSNLSKFTCTVCQQVYQGIDNLMQHVESVHLSSNPHECCICHKRFAQAGNVKRHIRFVHLRERPFQCRDCSSTFDRLCYLQRHMRSHLDSKSQTPDTSHLHPCNCPECGKRCLTAHHLRGHMQRKHFAKNKRQSDKMMEKYGHLFGKDLKVAGTQVFDEFGQPIESRPKSKKRRVLLDNDAVHQIASFSNHQHNIHPTLPAKIPDHGYVATGHNMHGSNLHEDYKYPSEKTPMKYLAMQKNDSKNANELKEALNKSNTNEEKTHLESHIVQSKMAEGNAWSDEMPDKPPTEADKPGHRKTAGKKSYKLYNSNCNFQKQKFKLLCYKCQHCAGRKFSSLAFLKSHIAVAHHSTTRRHLCLLCGRSYSSNLQLMAHVSKRHCSTKTKKRAPIRKEAKRPVANTFVVQPNFKKNDASFGHSTADLISVPSGPPQQGYQKTKLYDSVDRIQTQPLVPTQ